MAGTGAECLFGRAMPGEHLNEAQAAVVSEAGRLMRQANVGAVLVVDEGRLVGIFTERDAVYRVVALDRDPQAARHALIES